MQRSKKHQTVYEYLCNLQTDFGNCMALVDKYLNYSVNYNNMIKDIDFVAKGLISLGLKQNEHISQFSENNSRWMIIDLACQKSGIVNAVRGSNAPVSELKYIYNHSDSVALISDSLKLINNLEDFLIENKTKFVIYTGNEKIEKKAKIVGELSPVGSQLKSLIEERTSYEKQLNNSEKKIKAPKAGLVSYRIDNYENLLKPSSFSKLTIEELKKIKIPTDQVIPLNLNNVKIVNNFECYIAVPVYSEESKNVTLNSNVYLRFDNVGSELISATVEYILDETETSESGEAGKNKSGKIIVFKILTNVEELTKYRKINVDVVWWSDKGLKVNKEALSKVQMTNVSGDTIELSTLKIKKSSYTQEAWVKIVRSAGDFVIVENYTDKELREKGISELQINNRATIKMYDEVLIEKQKE